MSQARVPVEIACRDSCMGTSKGTSAQRLEFLPQAAAELGVANFELGPTPADYNYLRMNDVDGTANETTPSAGDLLRNVTTLVQAHKLVQTAVGSSYQANVPASTMQLLWLQELLGPGQGPTVYKLMHRIHNTGILPAPAAATLPSLLLGMPSRQTYDLLPQHDRPKAHHFHAMLANVGLNGVCLSTAASMEDGMPPWQEDWASHLQAACVGQLCVSLPVGSGERERFAAPRGLFNTSTTAHMLRLAVAKWRPHPRSVRQVLRIVVDAPPGPTADVQAYYFDPDLPRILDRIKNIVQHTGAAVA